MFSFFKKTKPSIDAVIFPDFGWKMKIGNSEVVRWYNAERTAGLTLHFFNAPPDAPPGSIDNIRAFYKNSALRNGLGMIEVTQFLCHGITCLKTIIKSSQNPSGISYIASLTIPFRDFSYVIKIQAAEQGTTGRREAIVGEKLLKNGSVTIENGQLNGWLIEPSPNGSFNMNQSELEDYDADFPDHHLSLTRKLISTIESNLQFRPEIKGLTPFYSV